MPAATAFSNLTPPCSNTGVVPPLVPPHNCVSVDWLSVTFPVGTDPSDLLDVFCSDEWTQLPHGRMGYSAAWKAGGITLLCAGNDDMGPHVIVSGDGCRELAARNRGFSWPTFLFDLIHWRSAKVTRIDIAWDDVEHLLDMPRIRRAAEHGHFSSRARKLAVTVSWEAGELSGVTVAHGSRSSETYVRIYDKALQLGLETHWIRCELELKGDRANGAARRIANRVDNDHIPTVRWLAGVLRQHLEYKVEGTHKDRSRWLPAPWWDNFLDHAAKCTIHLAPPQRQLERTLAWLKSIVAPSLALFLTAHGGDLQSLLSLCDAGKLRWRDRHRSLLQQAGFALA